MRKIIYLILFSVFNYMSGYCQTTPDQVNLMNGQTFTGSIVDTTNGLIKLKVPSRKKTRIYEFEQYRVYSLVHDKQPETILYRQDTAIGNYLSPKEMKYFFLGERDARLHYNPIGTKIAASLITFGLCLADTYEKDSLHPNNFFKGFYRSEPGLISIIAPFFATTLALIPAVKLHIDKVSDKTYLNQQSYLDGFEKIGRSKKVFGALKFSVIGCLAGVASYYIFRP